MGFVLSGNRSTREDEVQLVYLTGRPYPEKGWQSNRIEDAYRCTTEKEMIHLERFWVDFVNNMRRTPKVRNVVHPHPQWKWVGPLPEWVVPGARIEGTEYAFAVNDSRPWKITAVDSLIVRVENCGGVTTMPYPHTTFMRSWKHVITTRFEREI